MPRVLADETYMSNCLSLNGRVQLQSALPEYSSLGLTISMQVALTASLFSVNELQAKE